MDRQWEMILDRVGAMRSALIEGAFRERAVWLNLCAHAQVSDREEVGLWGYINAVYQKDGSVRPDASRLLPVDAIDPAVAAEIGRFARAAIQDGYDLLPNRRDWVIDIPLGDGRRLSLTLDQASRLGCAATRDALTH